MSAKDLALFWLWCRTCIHGDVMPVISLKVSSLVVANQFECIVVVIMKKIAAPFVTVSIGGVSTAGLCYKLDNIYGENRGLGLI